MTGLATAQYIVRDYQPDDEPGVIDLMRAALGESKDTPRSGRLWQWKHFDNPFGSSLVKVAVSSSGQIIGLRAFMRWQFHRNGEVVNAVRPVDTATHPDFQRQGIFARLTKEALADVGKDGTNIIFNTPNAKSGPGYIKLGWSEVGNIRPLIHVRNIPRVAVRVGLKTLGRSSKAAYSKDSFFKEQPLPLSPLLDDGRLPSLLERDAVRWGGLLHTPRSKEFLVWRYADHPTISYHGVSLEEQGDLIGFLIFRAKTRFGLKEIGVTEVMVARDDKRIVNSLIRLLKSTVAADYIVSYAPRNAFYSLALGKAGFRGIPGRGLTLVANSVAGPLDTLTDLDQWGLTLGDIEFF